MEQSKLVEVDGFRYLVSHAQVETAWEIGVELTKAVGAPVASMAQAASGGDDQIAAALSNAVNMLLKNIDAKESMRLMKRILSTVEVQGEIDGENKKLLLNEMGVKLHFQGRIGAMMKLVGEAVAFTHADFFDAIGDAVATMMKKTAERTAA